MTGRVEFPNGLSGLDKFQATVEHAEHAGQFMAALEDTPAGRDDAEDALLARQSWVLDDLEQRHFAGPAEDREHGTVGQMVDGVVAQFVGGDHAPVEPQYLFEFAAFEGDRQVEPFATSFMKRNQYPRCVPTLRTTIGHA